MSLLATSRSYSILPTPKPVASTTSAVYRSAASVRSATPGRTLCVELREWSGGVVVGTATGCVVVTTSWQQVPTIAYAARGGGALETHVFAEGAQPGDSFDVDDVVLTLG